MHTKRNLLIVIASLLFMIDVVMVMLIMRTIDNRVNAEMSEIYDRSYMPETDADTESDYGTSDLSGCSDDNISPTHSYSGSYNMDGLIDGQYKIVMRLTVLSSGQVTGKYAYCTTIDKYGDKPSSWIKLKGMMDGSSVSLSQVCPGTTETWPDIQGHFSYNDNRMTFSGQWKHNNLHYIEASE